jgi:hypothetical protein
MSNAQALNNTLTSNPHAKVPDGTFEVDGTQQVFPRGNNIRVRGNGPDSTTLRKSGGKNLLELDEAISAGGTVENIKVEDLTLEMNGGGQKAVRIDTDKGQKNFGTIRNVTFQNVVFSGTGISSGKSNARLVWLKGVIRGQGVTFRNCVFDMDAGAKVIGVYLAQNHPNKDRLPDDTRVRFENCRFTGGTTGIFTGVTTPARVAPLEVESCEFRDMTQTFEDTVTGAYYGRAIYAYKCGSLIVNDNKFVNCHETAHKFSDGGIVWADIGSYDTPEDPELTPSIYTERSPFQIEGNYFRSCVGNAIYVEDAKGGTVIANQILDLRDRVGASISIALSQFNGGPNKNIKSHGGHGILMGGGMDGCSVSHNKIKALDGHGIYQSPELSAKQKTDKVRRSKITYNHIADVGENVGPNDDTGTGIRSVSSGDFLNISGNVLRNSVPDGNNNLIPSGWGIALMRNNNSPSDLSYAKTRITGNVLTGWQYAMHSPGSPTEGLVVSHNTFKSISEADLSWRAFVGVLGPNSHSNAPNTDEVNTASNWSPGQIFISDDSAVIASQGGGLGEGDGRSQLQGTTVFKRDGLADGETLVRWEGHRNVSLIRSGPTAASAAYDWKSEGNNAIGFADQNGTPYVRVDYPNDHLELLNGTDLFGNDGSQVILSNPASSPTGSEFKLSSPGGNPGLSITEGDGVGGVKKRWDVLAGNSTFIVEDNSGNRLLHGVNDQVRIGDTSNPDAVVDSKGAVKISSNSASASAGMIRWTGSDFEGYDGNSWMALRGIDIEEGSITQVSDADPLDFAAGGFNITNPSGSKARIEINEEKIEDTVSALLNLNDGLTATYDDANDSYIINADLDIDDSGADIVGAHGINFGSNLNVTDDGDGTVTVDVLSGGDTHIDLEVDNVDQASDIEVLDLNAGTDVTLSSSSGDDTGERDVTISHADTSSQSDTSTSGANIIDGVTLDGRGHTTGLSTRTLQHSDLTINSDDHHTQPTTGDGLRGTTTFAVDAGNGISTATVVDDFEDGNITGWTNVTGTFSADSSNPINGTYSGKLKVSDDFNGADSPSYGLTTDDLRFKVKIKSDTGNSGDKVQVKVVDGASVKLGKLRFEDSTNDLIWNNGSANVLSSNFWSTGTVYNVRLSFDFSNNNVDVYVNGTQQGTTQNLENGSTNHDFIEFAIDTKESSKTRVAWIDDIKVGNSKVSVGPTVARTDQNEFFSAQLDVDEELIVGSGGASGQAGMIRWTGSDFEGYDGSSWVSLT